MGEGGGGGGGEGRMEVVRKSPGYFPESRMISNDSINGSKCISDSGTKTRLQLMLLPSVTR